MRQDYTEDHVRLFAPMTVPEEKALLAIDLIEGTSVRTVERVTKLHRDTILRLLVLAGERCIALMDTKMRNLQCQHDSGGRNLELRRQERSHLKVDDSTSLAMPGCSLRLTRRRS